jgi:hypothetical protein
VDAPLMQCSKWRHEVCIERVRASDDLRLQVLMLRRLMVLIAMLAASPAAATTYIPVDFHEMVTAAKAITYGRVVDVRSELTFDRTTIATYVTIDVAQHLKGNFGESVTFRVPGGHVGRYRRIIVGAPQFERGDDVIVFLSARGPSVPYLYGLSQGVYRVARRADGHAIVTPLPMPAGGGTLDRVVRGDPARRPLTLDAFAREVRSIL